MQVFQQFTGINVIIFYAPVLFQTMGFESNASLHSDVVIGGINVVPTLVSIVLVDKISRRKLLLENCVQMFIAQAWGRAQLVARPAPQHMAPEEFPAAVQVPDLVARFWQLMRGDIAHGVGEGQLWVEADGGVEALAERGRGVDGGGHGKVGVPLLPLLDGLDAQPTHPLAVKSAPGRGRCRWACTPPRSLSTRTRRSAPPPPPHPSHASTLLALGSVAEADADAQADAADVSMTMLTGPAHRPAPMRKKTKAACMVLPTVDCVVEHDGVDARELRWNTCMTMAITSGGRLSRRLSRRNGFFSVHNAAAVSHAKLISSNSSSTSLVLRILSSLARPATQRPRSTREGALINSVAF
ncbi:hypothetical protein ZWY2020_048912 [Hordeum vulgare]|nr:hypothetical protein ZWY2020_048912 [Hordeum vulgare]